MDGYGKYLHGTSGDTFEGTFSRGKRNGIGVHWYRETGILWEEEWCEGKLIMVKEKIAVPTMTARGSTRGADTGAAAPAMRELERQLSATSIGTINFDDTASRGQLQSTRSQLGSDSLTSVPVVRELARQLSETTLSASSDFRDIDGGKSASTRPLSSPQAVPDNLTSPLELSKKLFDAEERERELQRTANLRTLSNEPEVAATTPAATRDFDEDAKPTEGNENADGRATEVSRAGGIGAPVTHPGPRPTSVASSTTSATTTRSRVSTEELLEPVDVPARALHEQFLSKRTSTSSLRLRRERLQLGMSIDQCKSSRRLAEDFESLKLPHPIECAQAIKEGERSPYLIQSIVKFCDEVKQGEYQADHQVLQELKESIMFEAKGNFLLEQELEELGNKISLLVRNRITVQQIIAESSGMLRAIDKRSSTDACAHLKDKRNDYTILLEQLVRNPEILARVSRGVAAKDRDAFVHTVVFTLFGEQCDLRVDKQLLCIFALLLRQEFAEKSGIEPVLRSNTVVTKMLTAYSRRGEGQKLLKSVLAPSITEICNTPELNLELQPSKVHRYLVSSKETASGNALPNGSGTPSPFSGIRNRGRSTSGVTAAPALAGTTPVSAGLETVDVSELPEVKEEVGRRAALLQSMSKMVLDACLDSCLATPYGMRYISKQILELAAQFLPDQDPRVNDALVGGYMFLRYFNPALCTPDSLNIVPFTCTPVQRRNLVLIAKVVQCLSNDVLFGGKESFMEPLNGFLAENTDKLHAYIRRLVEVVDLDEHLYMEASFDAVPGVKDTSDHLIHISLNELFRIHRLCWDQLPPAGVGDEHPELSEVLRRLGPPPEAIPRDRDSFVYLKVNSPTTDEFEESASLRDAYAELKEVLFDVMREIPIRCYFDVKGRVPVSIPAPSFKASSDIDIRTLVRNPEAKMLLRQYLRLCQQKHAAASGVIDVLAAAQGAKRQHECLLRRTSSSDSLSPGIQAEMHECAARIAAVYSVAPEAIDLVLGDGSSATPPPDVAAVAAAAEACLKWLDFHHVRHDFCSHPVWSSRLASIFVEGRQNCGGMNSGNGGDAKDSPSPDSTSPLGGVSCVSAFSFSQCLVQGLAFAESGADYELADDVELLGEVCGEVAVLMGKSPMNPATFDEVFERLSKDVATFAKVIQNVKDNVVAARQILEQVRMRQSQLVDRVEYYAVYLENIRKKALYTEELSKVDGSTELVVQRFPYSQLEQKRIISASSLHKDLRKKIQIVIVTTDGRKFEVSALYKKLTVQKTTVELEDLLELQHEGKSSVQLQDMEFNINLFIHLLNSKFVSKLQKAASNARPQKHGGFSFLY